MAMSVMPMASPRPEVLRSSVTTVRQVAENSHDGEHHESEFASKSSNFAHRVKRISQVADQH